MSTVVGVDGCKEGWFYFLKYHQSISYGIEKNFESLIGSLKDSSRVFIDIPIGLVDSGTRTRKCDDVARKSLGSPRASSVFSAPAFPVLSAKNYEEAKKISQKAIGKMLSKQAFAIAPKILEVNKFLESRTTNNIIIREVHPEVCFWGLNNRQAMRFAKKKVEGFNERKRVLDRYLPNVGEVIEGPMTKYTRSKVARDDILDALVALVVGCTSEDKLKTMPSEPVFDTRGLPMEMVYTEEPNNTNCAF